MNRPVIVQIGAVAIDRLLEIANHAEMAGLRRCGFGLQPTASCVWRTGDFREDGKLRGIGVLCFVQDHVEVFFAQTRGRDGMLQQFVRKSDLVWVCDQAAFDTEIAEIPLHFGRNTECAVRHPCAQWCKRLGPTLLKVSRVTVANRPTDEFPPGLVSFLPIEQLRLRIRHGLFRTRWRNRRVHLSKIDRWTLADFALA